MDDLTWVSFVFGVATSIAAAMVLWLTGMVSKIRLPVPSEFLWRKLCDDLYIVLSQIPEKYDVDVKTGFQPPLTPIGDALALSELLNFVRNKLGKTVTVTYLKAEDDFERLQGKNLIVIGGPKYNLACSAAQTAYADQIPYNFARLAVTRNEWSTEDIHLKSLVGAKGLQNPLSFSLDPDSSDDFGSIIWMKNPLDSDKSMLLLGGLSTLSTVACIKWLLRQHGWKWIVPWRRKSGWQAVISCSLVDPVSVGDVKLRYFGGLI